MTYKAVLFDLDGTLLNTLEDITNAVDDVLRGHHFPTHDLSDYRSFISNGIVMLITRSLPEDYRDEDTIKTCVEEFKEAYSRCWKRMTAPYDGTVETLEKLVARNLKLAVLSNKTHNLTKKCVQEFLPNIAFDVVLGLSDDIPPKPDPTGAIHIADELNLPANQILFVGDSAADMKAATAAGMFPVGVLWGFKTIEELQRSGAKVLVEHPEEILDLVV
jgi:phosphoglycolate phosphatase